MALYQYLKQDTSVRRKTINYTSYVTLTFGAILLFWSFYPILSFEIYSRLFIRKAQQTPIPKSSKASSLEEAGSVLGNLSAFSSNLRDFTHANLWFPTKQQDKIAQSLNIKEYTLSIPKLNIKDAKVTVGGEDLSKSLVHYLPQSLPGEYGNVVIFGHSTLNQLYNVKDYKTIFTFLPNIEENDKIYVTVHDVTYEYKVFNIITVDPDQVSVLEQKKDSSYLTLITCVPPGTWWKRLVVRAKLTELPSEF